MNKIRLLCILLVFMTGRIYCQDQPKNIFGVSAGFAPAIMDMYFDMPFNFWPDRELSPVYHLFYARQVRESFRMGSYVEYEKINFSSESDNNLYNFKRYNIGLNWLGQFPKTALHAQLGGYLGYGFLRANNWDRLSGFDLGLMMGPAFELRKFGIAIHVQAGHAWYESDGSPSGVMLYTPKFMFKAYIKL